MYNPRPPLSLYYSFSQGKDACIRGYASYAGERGVERLVSAKYHDGEVRYYEGEHGIGRLVRSEGPNGCVHIFEGEMDAEQVARIEWKN